MEAQQQNPSEEAPGTVAAQRRRRMGWGGDAICQRFPSFIIIANKHQGLLNVSSGVKNAVTTLQSPILFCRVSNASEAPAYVWQGLLRPKMFSFEAGRLAAQERCG